MNEAERQLYDGHPLLDVLKEAEEARQKSRLDLFAAAALQGFCANPALDPVTQDTIVALSWDIAKAMIEQEPKPK